jgi:hypothetical protein
VYVPKIPALHRYPLTLTKVSANLPAVQLVQTVEPADAEYLPAGHNEHVTPDADASPVCPYFPAEQSVPEQVEAPAAEYWPASQLMQSVEAANPEYLPAVQLVQTEAPVDAMYVPAVQVLQTVEAARNPKQRWSSE